MKAATNDFEIASYHEDEADYLQWKEEEAKWFGETFQLQEVWCSNFVDIEDVYEKEKERVDYACSKIIEQELGSQFDMIVAIGPDGQKIASGIAKMMGIPYFSEEDVRDYPVTLQDKDVLIIDSWFGTGSRVNERFYKILGFYEQPRNFSQFSLYECKLSNQPLVHASVKGEKGGNASLVTYSADYFPPGLPVNEHEQNVVEGKLNGVSLASLNDDHQPCAKKTQNIPESSEQQQEFDPEPKDNELLEKRIKQAMDLRQKYKEVEAKLEVCDDIQQEAVLTNDLKILKEMIFRSIEQETLFESIEASQQFLDKIEEEQRVKYQNERENLKLLTSDDIRNIGRVVAEIQMTVQTRMDEQKMREQALAYGGYNDFDAKRAIPDQLLAHKLVKLQESLELILSFGKEQSKEDLYNMLRDEESRLQRANIEKSIIYRNIRWIKARLRDNFGRHTIDELNINNLEREVAQLKFICKENRNLFDDYEKVIIAIENRLEDLYGQIYDLGKGATLAAKSDFKEPFSQTAEKLEAEADYESIMQECDGQQPTANEANLDISQLNMEDIEISELKHILSTYLSDDQKDPQLQKIWDKIGELEQEKYELLKMGFEPDSARVSNIYYQLEKCISDLDIVQKEQDQTFLLANQLYLELTKGTPDLKKLEKIANKLPESVSAHFSPQTQVITKAQPDLRQQLQDLEKERDEMVSMGFEESQPARLSNVEMQIKELQTKLNQQSQGSSEDKDNQFQENVNSNQKERQFEVDRKRLMELMAEAKYMEESGLNKTSPVQYKLVLSNIAFLEEQTKIKVKPLTSEQAQNIIEPKFDNIEEEFEAVKAKMMNTYMDSEPEDLPSVLKSKDLYLFQKQKAVLQQEKDDMIKQGLQDKQPDKFSDLQYLIDELNNRIQAVLGPDESKTEEQKREDDRAKQKEQIRRQIMNKAKDKWRNDMRAELKRLVDQKSKLERMRLRGSMPTKFNLLENKIAKLLDQIHVIDKDLDEQEWNDSQNPKYHPTEDEWGHSVDEIEQEQKQDEKAHEDAKQAEKEQTVMELIFDEIDDLREDLAKLENLQNDMTNQQLQNDDIHSQIKQMRDKITNSRLNGIQQEVLDNHLQTQLSSNKKDNNFGDIVNSIENLIEQTENIKEKFHQMGYWDVLIVGLFSDQMNLLEQTKLKVVTNSWKMHDYLEIQKLESKIKELTQKKEELQKTLDPPDYYDEMDEIDFELRALNNKIVALNTGIKVGVPQEVQNLYKERDDRFWHEDMDEDSENIKALDRAIEKAEKKYGLPSSKEKAQKQAIKREIGANYTEMEKLLSVLTIAAQNQNAKLVDETVSELNYRTNENTNRLLEYHSLRISEDFEGNMDQMQADSKENVAKNDQIRLAIEKAYKILDQKKQENDKKTLEKAVNQKTVDEKAEVKEEEMIVLVNENNTEIGEVARSFMEEKKLWSRSSVVFVYSPKKNAFLVQKRSMNKSYAPGFYDLAFGGIVSSDDKSNELNARREIEEELGIPMGTAQAEKLLDGKKLSESEKAKIKKLEFISTIKVEEDVLNQFCNVYLLIDDCEHIQIQTEEVDHVDFWSVQEIEKALCEWTDVTLDSILSYQQLYESKAFKNLNVVEGEKHAGSINHHLKDIKNMVIYDVKPGQELCVYGPCQMKMDSEWNWRIKGNSVELEESGYSKAAGRVFFRFKVREDAQVDSDCQVQFKRKGWQSDDEEDADTQLNLTVREPSEYEE